MAIVVRQNGRENCGPLRALRDLQEAFSSRRLFPTTREAQRGADETESMDRHSREREKRGPCLEFSVRREREGEAREREERRMDVAR
ncbi:hypothetical protein SAY87_024602 [Trapa incisa]|uniref:Uncharacterized protein n=1 Tax=Trapa incisa TaxID=236973 RepID=A0AAN7GPH6_9MYRT|nr:hypothetical protein SAY87_024602 [Trapa incisa]